MKKDSGLVLQRNVRPKKIDQTFKKIDRTEKAGVVWFSGLTGEDKRQREKEGGGTIKKKVQSARR